MITKTTTPITRGNQAPPGESNGNCPGAEHRADCALRPPSTCQIDGNKRSKARLEIGDEKVEPIKPRQPSRRHRIHSTFVADAQQHDVFFPAATGLG
jgi:hypothetical protein